MTLFAEIMDILKFYRHRKSIPQELLNKVNQLQLPLDYSGFILRFRPQSITTLLTKSPHRIGIINNDDCLLIDFLDVNDLWLYEVDLGDGKILKPGVIKIADNNIPEGGIFLNVNDGSIYNFINEPISLERSEWNTISNSFSELLSKMNFLLKKIMFGKWMICS